MTKKLKVLSVGMAVALTLYGGTAFSSSFQSSGIINSLMGNMSNTSSTNACSQVAANQTALARSALQQCDQIGGSTFTPAYNVNNASCMGGILGSMSSTAMNLESMVSGGPQGLIGALGSMFKSMGSSLYSSLSNQVCSSANMEWNTVSGSINNTANLPSTLGQAATSTVSNTAGGALNNTLGSSTNSLNQTISPVTNLPYTVQGAANSAGSSVTNSTNQGLGGLL
jgi:hypothetical protein